MSLHHSDPSLRLRIIRHVALLASMSIFVILHTQGLPSPRLSPADLYGDDIGYHSMAINILQGKGPVNTASDPLFLPPLYPYFIAAVYAVFGPRPYYVLLVQSFLLSLIIPLLFYAGRRLFGDPEAWLAIALWLAYPFIYRWAHRLLTDSLYTLLYLAAFSAFIAYASRPTWRRISLAGFFVGVMFLQRGIAFFLLPLLLLWLIALHKGHLRGLLHWLLILAFPILFIGGITVYNYRLHQRLIPLAAHGGYALYYGNNPYSKTGYTADGEAIRFMEPEYKEWVRQYDFITLNNILYRRALGFIVRHPFLFVRRTIARFWTYWKPLGSAYKHIHVNKHLDFLLIQRIEYLIFPLFLAALILVIRRQRWPYPTLMLIFLISHSLTHALCSVENTGRYKLPLMPIVILYASSGAVFLVCWICGRCTIGRNHEKENRPSFP